MIWCDRLALCWGLLIIPLLFFGWIANNQPPDEIRQCAPVDIPPPPPGYTLDPSPCTRWASRALTAEETKLFADLYSKDLREKLPLYTIKAALIFVALPWFVLRSLHFVVTGRIRPKRIMASPEKSPRPSPPVTARAADWYE
jgi:hypothetical protein